MEQLKGAWTISKSSYSKETYMVAFFNIFRVFKYSKLL